MDDLIGWLARDGNGLATAQVVAALVTALATLALWRVTRVLAAETTALAKMTSHPFVVCSLESSGASAIALNLALRNTGNATAFDIELHITPALPSADGKPKPEDKETTFHASLLPPEQALHIQGVMGPEVHDLDYTASISWSDMPNGSKRESLSYSFNARDGFRGGWNTKSTHDVAEELKKIRELVKSQSGKGK